MKEKDVISQFFGSLPIILETEDVSEPNMECCLELLKTASDAFDETIYVVDFRRRCFRFVSNNGIFLSGRTPDEVQRLGYEFYPEVIDPKDYQLIARIHRVVLDYFSQQDTPICDLGYIVFDFKINGYKGKVRLSHKVMPLLVVNNQVLTAICIVSRSVSKKSGNLYAYYYGKEGVCYQYSFDDDLWKQEPMIKLTPEEWKILSVAKQELTGEEMADIIGTSHQDLRNTLTSIYRKLKVRTRKQAEIFANNHRIIIEPDKNRNRKKPKEQPKGKKQRRKITPDQFQRIQEGLNKGESVNSIAKRENLRESNIRYHKVRGKLKK